MQSGPERHNDSWLVELIRSRDPCGIEGILRSHGERVRGHLVERFGWHLADEALHEASIAVWQKIDQFDQSKGPLGAWFLRIAHNKAVDLLRQSKCDAHVSIDAFDIDVPDTKMNGCDSLADQGKPAFDQRSVPEIETCISQLPPLQRAVIRADLHSPNTTADAASLAYELNTTPNAIYAARSKAKRKLRESGVKFDG